MARKTSQIQRSRKNSKNSSSRFLIVGIGVCLVALIVAGVYFLISDSDYYFERSQLDKYVELTQQAELLDDGAAVYVDMSDGMIFAYATEQNQNILQGVINKLAANEAVKFFGLADEKIFPLEKTHTELYNYLLDSKSYDKQKAPIELTLEQIVKQQQPALLMSDFEEYKGGVIEKAAYAKKYFIEWLAKGFNITFYKWNFDEQGKAKQMYLAVFDDNANRLASQVENAVKLVNPNIETFVIGSRDFAYPTSTEYLSFKQGGNYHNKDGKDIVTAVVENGGVNDYVSYAKPFANASGTPGQFAPLDNLLGAFAEYYPFGVKWSDAITNAKMMQENGIKLENKYQHLFSNLFVNFAAQDGYSIEEIEIRVFDMQKTMEYIAHHNNPDSIKVKDVEEIDKPELNMVLTAGLESDKTLPTGWQEIVVDFDEKFDGTFIGGVPSTNLLRANIVISKVRPEINKAVSFFTCDGNLSLANSVVETLNASTSQPQGRILYTYYIKTLSE